jgi:hypothetical protein
MKEGGAMRRRGSGAERGWWKEAALPAVKGGTRRMRWRGKTRTRKKMTMGEDDVVGPAHLSLYVQASTRYMTQNTSNRRSPYLTLHALATKPMPTKDK